jgi:hypothetical protein
MSHYANKYENDWDEFVDYALMAHRAIPLSVTRYSPFYLLHEPQMRIPMEDDLTTAKFGGMDEGTTVVRFKITLTLWLTV